MEAFLVSTGIVALAEMGDKTQLLSLVLAARYRKPLPIILGIFIATLVNHGFAGALGGWITHVLGADVLRWILGVGFIAMAGWMLIPDKLDDAEQGKPAKGALGILGTTIVAFFFAEMGDKTQIATVALAARFSGEVIGVVAGTTFGMMLANAPAVLLGDRFANKMPIALVHKIAAAIFLVLGVLALLGVGA
ncbi:TMEM165/GDT1 family protein [Cupriavidus sp. 30B13]|uniref:TMEM165/GDT1 family protein n=1 Tax=Cupriavidus sp. 30B13 TaxID=3384241 RepID=UPI003B8F45AE